MTNPCHLVVDALGYYTNQCTGIIVLISLGTLLIVFFSFFQVSLRDNLMTITAILLYSVLFHLLPLPRGADLVAVVYSGSVLIFFVNR